MKKQVFELLSALCVYSSDGYNRALEALEHYKTFQSERYRFKLVVDELRAAKTEEYKTVLLAFVNCLIISTPQLKVRKGKRPIGLKENVVCGFGFLIRNKILFQFSFKIAIFQKMQEMSYQIKG